ncbi:permease [Gloeothece verrucosa]|uniref:permease n=1 Tax=Gloeothece verrucosa TaxID=2546359 RepID=UPI0005A51B0B|nr:permease [Gloeothece verrucosa]
MNQLYSAFTLFLSLLVEAIPFLLLGVMLSSALLIFIDVDKLIKVMPRNPILGAIVGSCIGFLFPVCECGNVPVARRLLLEGMPTSVAIAFLLAAPTINPVVVWSTWVAFRDQPEIVIGRVVFSLAIAICIACVFSVQKDPRPLLQPVLAKRVRCLSSPSPQQLATVVAPSPTVPSLLQSGTYLIGSGGQPLRMDDLAAKTNFSASNSKYQVFLDNVVQELRELGGMLVLGSVIAAGIQIFVPREIILSLGQDSLTSILAMMLLAGIISICSTVDSFFALSFAATFTSSSLLAFLVFGPMIDIKSMGLMLSIFKPRMLIYLFALAAQLTLILTLCHSYFF